LIKLTIDLISDFMKFKIFIFFAILFSIIIYSQRRNDFTYSDKIPDCSLINNGNFTRYEKNSLKIKFRKNRMIEIIGKKIVTVGSSLKMLSKCKFETEIKSIKTKYQITDDFIYIGKKTVYEIVETGKNYIIIEYSCNEDRNTCSEILDKK